MRSMALVLLFLLFPLTSSSQAEEGHASHAEEPAVSGVTLALFPERLPRPGEAVRVVAQLTYKGKPLEADQLKTVHTEKFHLMLVDPSLTDYHHIHPQPTATPGSYQFTFMPAAANGYRAWADITPMDTGSQELAVADLGTPQPAKIDKTVFYMSRASGYYVTLSLNAPPVVGKPLECTFTVADSTGNAITKLEPLMGTFGHLVGFYEDYRTIVHTHPTGEEPKGDDARSGPFLAFHVQPDRAGFIKLFLRFKHNGRNVAVPFGLNIATAGR